MPRILTFGPYVIFFWVAENGEPVHVRVSVKRPTEESTKFWPTSNGGFLLAESGARIPPKDLRDLAKVIKYNHGYICDRWCERFGEGAVCFYT